MKIVFKKQYSQEASAQPKEVIEKFKINAFSSLVDSLKTLDKELNNHLNNKIERDENKQ